MILDLEFLIHVLNENCIHMFPHVRNKKFLYVVANAKALYLDPLNIPLCFKTENNSHILGDSTPFPLFFCS